MTQTISADAIASAWDNLKEAKKTEYEITCKAYLAKQDLKQMEDELSDKETLALLNGENTGKNAEIRAAWNRQTFVEEYEQISEARQEVQAIDGEVAHVHHLTEQAWLETEKLDRLLTLLQMQEALAV